MTRFASSRSDGRPVSFHQPLTISARTVSALIDQPLDRFGDLVLAAPRRLRACRPPPGSSRRRGTRRRVPDRSRTSCGFSTSRTTRSPSRTATPNRSGSRTRARKICASGRVRSNSSTNRPSPSSRTLSPRYIRNGLARDEVAGRQDRVRQTERPLLLDVGDEQPPRGAVADRGADLVAGLTDHDADLGDPGVADRLERVEQDRRAGDGDQLLRVRVRERTEARPLAAGQDQRAHHATPARCSPSMRRPLAADGLQVEAARDEDRDRAAPAACRRTPRAAPDSGSTSATTSASLEMPGLYAITEPFTPAPYVAKSTIPGEMSNPASTGSAPPRRRCRPSRGRRPAPRCSPPTVPCRGASRPTSRAACPAGSRAKIWSASGSGNSTDRVPSKSPDRRHRPELDRARGDALAAA